MKKPNPDSCHLHIIYLCIIFTIVLGFMIVCFCKGRISENAYQNVSFAATVSSILLALISIVLSMNAANTTSINLGSMSELERKLNESLDRLDEIRKRIDRSEKKIDKLPLEGNLEPSQIAADAIKLNKKSYLFMMMGHKSDAYKQYEDAAIKELCRELGLRNVQRDVSLKDNSRIVFDAIAKGYGLTYLIEVKICDSIAEAKQQYRHFISRMQEILEMYYMNDLLIYLLFVCRGNNKDEICSAIQEVQAVDDSQIGIVFYNESDLKTKK